MMQAFRRVTRLTLPLAAFAMLFTGPAAAQAPSFISIGTASPAGAYYPLGVAMADLWNRNIPGIRFSAQETGGGVANINLINSGEIELGIANENIAWDASQGNEPFKAPIEIQGGWVMNASYALIVVPAKSGMTSVADLAGRRVSLGAPGSSGNVIGQRLLESQGVAEGKYTPVFMGWQESADAIADGSLDAAVMVGGQPFPAVESLAVRMPITILSFDGERLVDSAGFPLVPSTIPGNTYHNLTTDSDAIAVRSIVYIKPGLDEDTVYQMVKTVFENIPALKAAHPSGDQAALLSQKQAEALDLTMNPGVIRYAKEVGAW